MEENNNLQNFYLEHTTDEGWVLSGSTLLSDLSDLLDIKFQPQGRYKTIAGFVMTELGYIPNEGDQLSKFGYTFTVKTRCYLRIVDVHIEQNLRERADG